MRKVISDFQPVLFKEHPVLWEFESKPQDFDIVMSRGIEEFDHIQYNVLLLEKLSMLSGALLNRFLKYQCKQLKDPYKWIQTIRLMLNANKEALMNIIPVDQLNLIYDNLNELEQNYDNLFLSKQPVVLTLKHSILNSEAFEIEKVKEHIRKMKSRKKKLAYLHRQKTDYLQKHIIGKEDGSTTFLEQIELEISLLQKLDDLQIDEIELADDAPTITWYGNANQLVAEFLRLRKKHSRNGEPLMKLSQKDLVHFLYVSFRKPDGTSFSKHTLHTYVTPSNEHKLPRNIDQQANDEESKEEESS